MQTDSSGEDLSDSEILDKCEQQLSELNNMDEDNLERGRGDEEEIARNTEKRKEPEDANNEDDFITVVRSKPKRLLRSNSLEQSGQLSPTQSTAGHRPTPGCSTSQHPLPSASEIAKHEVCVSSKENLPKPIAFAKLLRQENIKDILRIKYKSPNKVFIQCQREEDARKLIECKQFKEIGLRCQLIQEMSVSYGIVKGIDLELSEEELMSILKSNVDVLSVRRLKRLMPEGKWVDCESVRVCFKSNLLPQYIYAYDCRFQVDPYVFPVTQCSGCWQFGHFIKYCPTKKVMCPKCGGSHENCTITDFKCLNCKGNHFVLDKTCPIYLKERTIRNIMSEEHVTYRRALQILKEKKEKQILNINENTQENNNNQFATVTEKETYSSVVTRAVIHEKPLSYREEEGSDTSSNTRQSNKNTKQKSRKQNRCQNKNNESLEETIIIEEINNKSQEEKRSSKQNAQLLYKFEWAKIWTKIKGICKSNLKLEEKTLSLLKLIVEELKNFFIHIIFGEDMLGFIKCFNNG